MKKHTLFFLLALVSVLELGIADLAKAAFTTNVDFSDGMGGVTSASGTGRVSVVDYNNIPLHYRDIWDLSAWNNQMHDNFALYEGTFMLGGSIQVPSSTLSSISFDYAAAWDWSNPKYNNDHGYLRVEAWGVTEDGGVRRWPIYKELVWGPGGNGPANGVITGHYNIPNMYSDPYTAYTEVGWFITALNPNQTFTQIVGIDNISMTVQPLPVPSAMLLLGSGLFGLAVLRRKLNRG